MRNTKPNTTGSGSQDMLPFGADLARVYIESIAEDARYDGLTLGAVSKPRVKLGRDVMSRIPEYAEGNKQVYELMQILADPCFFYDEVKAIEDLPPEPTFDFTMPETHSFIAESIINHNSTMAVHFTKMATTFDTVVVWIDVEATASVDNLTQLGVDPSKVFIVQPEEGEVLTIEYVTQKLREIIQTFGEANIPVLVIWDSLASTAAEQQLKDGFNPNQLGVVAKSIANMTIQIGQGIAQNNIIFLILNQGRDDLKANPMYPQIKSTGGRAMEHWASLRLEVAKASQIKEKVTNPATGKESDEYVGHIFRVKTKKSKLSAPNKQAEMYLISQPYIGFDFTENVYRSAVDQYGLISKGAWRVYTTDAGQEYKLRDRDWVPFLNSEEGQPVLKELFQKELITWFPDGFAPLNNKRINVDSFPYLEGMREYYAQRATQKALEEPQSQEGEE